MVEVGIDDAYLRHVLGVHADDLAATHPGFSMSAVRGRFRRHASAGPPRIARRSSCCAAMRPSGWCWSATPARVSARSSSTTSPQRFRDFTPGEFVYRKSGVFADKGFTRLVADAGPGTSDHYGRVGFQRVGDHWERPVDAAA